MIVHLVRPGTPVCLIGATYGDLFIRVGIPVVVFHYENDHGSFRDGDLCLGTDGFFKGSSEFLTKPPVSTTVNCLPFQIQALYWRSR